MFSCFRRGRTVKVWSWLSGNFFVNGKKWEKDTKFDKKDTKFDFKGTFFTLWLLDPVIIFRYRFVFLTWTFTFWNYFLFQKAVQIIFYLGIIDFWIWFLYYAAEFFSDANFWSIGFWKRKITIWTLFCWLWIFLKAKFWIMEFLLTSFWFKLKKNKITVRNFLAQLFDDRGIWQKNFLRLAILFWFKLAANSLR